MFDVDWWHISLVSNLGIMLFFLATSASIGIRWWVSKADDPPVVPVSALAPKWWYSREREMGWFTLIFFACALGHGAMLTHLLFGMIGLSSNAQYNAAKLDSDWHIGVTSVFTLWVGGMYWKHITDKQQVQARKTPGQSDTNT